MTRLVLLQKLARRLNKNATTIDALTQSRLLDFLNERERRLLTLPGLSHLRHATITLASVVDQADYVLPSLSKIDRIWDATNARTLYELSLQDYRLMDPNSLSGTPEAFVWRGQQATAKNPADASELFVKSTTTDTTQVAYVEGVITGGYPRTASVTLTGTTAVTLDSTITTWIRVDKFYLSAVGVGTITLHEDRGVGTELARIAIGFLQTKYWVFELAPQPAGVNTVPVTRLL